MKRLLFGALLTVLWTVVFASTTWADGGSTSYPLSPPEPGTFYGMDLMGPGWQWTFPREAAHPRRDGPVRVDLMDALFRQSWAAGVRTARIAVFWCLTEPEKDQYRWEELDVAFQLAHNYGMEVIAQIFYTPDWAVLGHSSGVNCFDYVHYPRNQPPKDWNDWADFMAAITQRYGRAGKNQVHNWEIWNEPDLYEFWYVPEDPEHKNVPAYAKLVRLAAEQVRRYDPGGRVLVGSLSDIGGVGFLDRLMHLQGENAVRDDADVITFHVFGEPDRKLAGIRSVLGDDPLPIWSTETNTPDWKETVPAHELARFFQKFKDHGVDRVIWFQSWTSDWGPGIFQAFEPLWERTSFQPSPFYATYQHQALQTRLPAAPLLRSPHNYQRTGSRPLFQWTPPEPGDNPIVGYKLQADDSRFWGHPYFHTPELDVWVPASVMHFLPLQMFGSTRVQRRHQRPVLSSTLPPLSYQPSQPLPPGRYYWRVAAVDARGNVGPYSEVQVLDVTVGDQRVFLPVFWK